MLDDLSVTAYLFKLPQFCGGCYNYYKVLGIISNDGKFDYFSLMDAYYYQQEIEWTQDNKNLLEKGINSVLSKYIIFQDFSFENPQDIKELQRFIDFICNDLLGCRKLASEEDFKQLVDEIEADFDVVCFEQMKKLGDRVNKILSSKKHILYSYHGALYEFAFNKEEGEALSVNVTLYPASCFNNYMI